MPEEVIRLRTVLESWRDTHGDSSRLKSLISINDTLMHLEAIQVQLVGDPSVQEAVNEHDAGDFSLVCRLGSEGPLDTTEINGKQYVLFATPFA